MSTLISDIASEASIIIGDDKFSRVTRGNWLVFANRRMRKLCMRLNIVKRRARFNIVANNEIYALPANCVQMTRLQFTDTPSDIGTFRDLRERFEDDFRDATSNQYPTGDPDRYFADQGFFYLLPMPTTSVALGGRIEYWGLPDAALAQEDAISLPETMHDLLVEGIVIDAQRKMEKFDQAAVSEQEWENTISETRVKLEDRSSDRRSKVRVSAMQRGFSGQT